MILFLTILHFLAFAAGIGGALANLVVLRVVRAAPAEQAPVLRSVMPRIAAVGFHSIVLLWITGPLLLWLAYDSGAGLSPWFYIKLVFAVALTATAILARWTVARVKAGKAAPLGPHMPKLVVAAAIFGPLTLICAVLAFS